MIFFCNETIKLILIIKFLTKIMSRRNIRTSRRNKEINAKKFVLIKEKLIDLFDGDVFFDRIISKIRLIEDGFKVAPQSQATKDNQYFIKICELLLDIDDEKGLAFSDLKKMIRQQNPHYELISPELEKEAIKKIIIDADSFDKSEDYKKIRRVLRKTKLSKDSRDELNSDFASLLFIYNYIISGEAAELNEDQINEIIAEELSKASRYIADNRLYNSADIDDEVFENEEERNQEGDFVRSIFDEKNNFSELSLVDDEVFVDDEDFAQDFSTNPSVSSYSEPKPRNLSSLRHSQSRSDLMIETGNDDFRSSSSVVKSGGRRKNIREKKELIEGQTVTEQTSRKTNILETKSPDISSSSPKTSSNPEDSWSKQFSQIGKIEADKSSNLSSSTITKRTKTTRRRKKTPNLSDSQIGQLKIKVSLLEGERRDLNRKIADLKYSKKSEEEINNEFLNFVLTFSGQNKEMLKFSLEKYLSNYSKISGLDQKEALTELTQRSQYLSSNQKYLKYFSTIGSTKIALTELLKESEPTLGNNPRKINKQIESLTSENALLQSQYDFFEREKMREENNMPVPQMLTEQDKYRHIIKYIDAIQTFSELEGGKDIYRKYIEEYADMKNMSIADCASYFHLRNSQLSAEPIFASYIQLFAECNEIVENLQQEYSAQQLSEISSSRVALAQAETEIVDYEMTESRAPATSTRPAPSESGSRLTEQRSERNL